jgi:hypothetical protein
MMARGKDWWPNTSSSKIRLPSKVVLKELQVDSTPALNTLKDFARNEEGQIDYHKLWNLLPRTSPAPSSPVKQKIEAVVAEQPDLTLPPPGTIMVQCIYPETSKESHP